MNWKTRKFITAVVTVILLGVGVTKPELFSSVIADGLCAEVGCDAT